MTIVRNVCRSLIKRASLIQSNARFLSGTPALKAYDGEGKTTMSILNNEDGANLMINGFSQVGFRLNNDVTVLGSIAIFPRSILSWNVDDVGAITEESLQLFAVLEPKIDILVIGTGDKLDDPGLHKRLFPFSVKNKINLEILATEQACSTFNFLNSEGRYVAGAMLPPTKIETTDDDLLRSKMRYQNLYGPDEALIKET